MIAEYERAQILEPFCAPDDQPDAGGGSITEHHRRAGFDGPVGANE
jgi:hypothetical protein